MNSGNDSGRKEQSWRAFHQQGRRVPPAPSLPDFLACTQVPNDDWGPQTPEVLVGLEEPGLDSRSLGSWWAEPKQAQPHVQGRPFRWLAGIRVGVCKMARDTQVLSHEPQSRKSPEEEHPLRIAHRSVFSLWSCAGGSPCRKALWEAQAYPLARGSRSMTISLFFPVWKQAWPPQHESVWDHPKWGRPPHTPYIRWGAESELG